MVNILKSLSNKNGLRFVNNQNVLLPISIAPQISTAPHSINIFTNSRLNILRQGMFISPSLSHSLFPSQFKLLITRSAHSLLFRLFCRCCCCFFSTPHYLIDSSKSTLKKPNTSLINSKSASSHLSS